MIKPQAERLRDHFVGWQCRLRADAMRRLDGRPVPAMRPRVTRHDGTEIAEAVTVLLMRKDPGPSTAEFRHLLRRTHDPRARQDAAVALLAERFYQPATVFSDVLTATFAAGSKIAASLVHERRCILEFAQDSQRYDVPCAVTSLPSDDAFWQATYWHNALFNATLPPTIDVLCFKPRWLDATAEPAPKFAAQR
jgi:hypothetical protein